MVSTGWLCLAAMVVVYGSANLLQSIGARRCDTHHSMHPGFLWRLAGQRVYLYGVGFQLLGFGLAFVARRELPLFLVQGSVAAGLGVMALLGVVLLKWRLPRAEVALLVLLGFGVTGLVLSAKPGTAHRITMTGVAILTVGLIAIAVIGAFAARLKGVPGSVVLGSLAGLAFGGAAIDSRTLAGMHSMHGVITHPLLYLLAAHALVGQLLLAMALQRGSSTAAVAAMDAAATAPAAIIGLVMLGDQIWPGRQWLAAVGFLCTLVAVLGLSRYARPQHHGRPVPQDAALPVPQDAALAVPAQAAKRTGVPGQKPWPAVAGRGPHRPATGLPPARGGLPPRRNRPYGASTSI